jgi:phage-related protein
VLEPNLILTVAFYRTAAGKVPVLEWLHDLKRQDRQAVGRDLKRVQIGWPLGMPLVRKMQTDLWEVRCDISDGIARVFFTTRNKEMWLLHGIVKKSGKTPEADLKLAIKRMKEVKNAA